MQAILAKLHAEGHFYKETYRGFYSARQETFLTHKDRLPDGTFDPSWGEVVELEEENYYFRLKDHQQWLIEHIEQNPCFISPVAPQRGAGFPQEQRAGRPVHQPPRFAPELGHSPALRTQNRAPTDGRDRWRLPSSDNASAKPMLMPAPLLAARPTRNVSQLLCVANAAANSGASVEIEPSSVLASNALRTMFTCSLWRGRLTICARITPPRLHT